MADGILIRGPYRPLNAPEPEPLADSLADGHALVTGEFGQAVEVATRQCVHCGHHWLWVKGSKRKRGWCMSCNGITCGPRCPRTCETNWRKEAGI